MCESCLVFPMRQWLLDIKTTSLHCFVFSFCFALQQQLLYKHTDVIQYDSQTLVGYRKINRLTLARWMNGHLFIDALQKSIQPKG